LPAVKRTPPLLTGYNTPAAQVLIAYRDGRFRTMTATGTKSQKPAYHVCPLADARGSAGRGKGGPVDLAGAGLGDGNAIGFERRTDGLIQGHAGAAVGSQRGDLGGLRGRQVALLLHDVVGGGRPQNEFPLLRVVELLLKGSGPGRR
jgi:hypothetical protein